MLAYSYQRQKSTLLARSYLRVFYRQAIPNFAYLFEEKIPAYSLISTYSFIRELRVGENIKPNPSFYASSVSISYKFIGRV